MPCGAAVFLPVSKHKLATDVTPRSRANAKRSESSDDCTIGQSQAPTSKEVKWGSLTSALTEDSGFQDDDQENVQYQNESSRLHSAANQAAYRITHADHHRSVWFDVTLPVYS